MGTKWIVEVIWTPKRSKNRPCGLVRTEINTEQQGLLERCVKVGEVPIGSKENEKGYMKDV